MLVLCCFEKKNNKINGVIVNAQTLQIELCSATYNNIGIRNECHNNIDTHSFSITSDEQHTVRRNDRNVYCNSMV